MANYGSGSLGIFHVFKYLRNFAYTLPEYPGCRASGGNRSSYMAVWTPDKAAPPIGPSAAALSPFANEGGVCSCSIRRFAANTHRNALRPQPPLVIAAAEVFHDLPSRARSGLIALCNKKGADRSRRYLRNDIVERGWVPAGYPVE